MAGTTRASPGITIPFGSCTITAQTEEEAVSLLLKVIQEYENSRTHGDSNRQAAQKSVKGKAKRTTSEAEQALLEPSAKRLRTTQATQTYPHDFLAVRQAIQHDSNEAVEVNGVICIDIEPHAASDPSAEQAQQAQQNAQAVQVHDPKPHAAPKSRGKETQQGRKTAQAVQLRASKPHVASKPRGKQAQQEQNEAQAVQVHGRKPHAASELSDKQAQAQAVQAHGPKPRAGKGPKRKKAQQPRHGVEAMQMDGPKPPAASEASGKQAQQGPQKAQAARVKVPKPRAASRAKGKQAQAQAKPRAGAGPRRKQAQRARQEAQAAVVTGHGHETPAQQARRLGNHFGDRPHRLIIGGENPSKWREGHPGPRPYGHSTNKFWATAKEAGIVTAELADDEEYDKGKMLEQISFMDIKLVLWELGITQGDDFRTPGGRNNTEWFRQHTPAFYVRLEEAMARASDSIKCTCGECRAPAFFVWQGKHAWEHLLKIDGIKVRRGGVKYGLQTVKPKGWPLPKQTQVWVLPSTSGQNVSSRKGGQAWWNAFGKAYCARFAAREWPWKPQCYPQ